jgi:hypothetical protein
MGHHSYRIRRIIRGSQLFALITLATVGTTFVSAVPPQPSGRPTVALDDAFQPAVGVAVGRAVMSASPAKFTANLRSVSKVPRVQKVTSEDSHRAAAKRVVDRVKAHPARPVAHPSSSAPRAMTESAAEPNAYGCGAALAYLQAHAAPGFSFECPGWAEGNQGMTCMDMPGVCPGKMVIAISTPCAAAYMNEASNSWVFLGLSDAPIDPYGYCSE